ncbi:Sodium channel protein Nach [Harpegnathos saltator]|uniref:Sodium channel protein Nach n=1 Tax=Harpegnathos saltator TaxID=610380 RepID=E2BBT1_HARSA|nr:Sodium channel protein Nach [Harpegnathos saltator]
MLPKTSRERRRYATKRVLVDHMRASRKTGKWPLEHADAKLRDDRSKDKSAKSTVRKFLTEYLQDSSLHGVKYLSNLSIRPSIVGKVGWALIMICSFVFLIWMVYTFWRRYSANPFRTVVESFQAPIFMIPFPAVTLCPLVPPLAARRGQLLQRLRLPADVDNNTAMFLLKYGTAFASERVLGGKNHLNKLRTLLEVNNMTLLELLKFLRPCEDLIESCWWDGEKKNCSEIFRVSHASQGVCCSFNFLLEDYIANSNLGIIRYIKTAFFGPASGLVITLHRKLLVENDGTGEFVKYSTNSVGILVYTHHPLEYLGAIANRHLLQAGQELRIAVIPYVKKKLSGYSRLNARNELVPHCVKNEAAKLKYLPVYLYSNCFVDCSIEAALRICGCVPFYYEAVAICDWENFNCLYENADNIRVIQESRMGNFTCRCYSPCLEVFYDSRGTTVVLNRHESNVWSTQ